MIIDGNDLKPIKKRLYVTNMTWGEQKLKSGIIIKDREMTTEGIHPRWAKVFKIGPEVTDIETGDYILISHGRWSHNFKILNDDKEMKCWYVDYPDGVLLVSKEKPKEVEEYAEN